MGKGIGIEGRISAEYERRRRRAQATAAALGSGSDEVDLADVMAETDSLLAYRTQIPELRRAHRRGRDRDVFLAFAVVAGLNLLALIACGFVGVIGWGWLVLLFPALAGLLVLLVAVDLDSGGDKDGALAPLWGGFGLLVGAAALSLLVLHGLALLWIAVMVAVASVSIGSWIEHVGVRS